MTHARTVRTLSALIVAIGVVAAFAVVDVSAGATPGVPGSISTVAGIEPPFRLTGPRGVAFDGTLMYLSTDSDQVIAVRDLVAGTETRIAGTQGVGGMSGDGGPATAAHLSIGRTLAVASDGDVFFTDNNNYIRRVDAATGTLQLVAGSGGTTTDCTGGPATAAAIGWPNGLALDSADNVYFSSEGYVCRVDAVTGSISVYAGDGSVGSSGDGGAATAASLRYPDGLAVDSTDNVYIGEFGRIRRVDALTGVIDTVVGTGTAVAGADGQLPLATDIDGEWGLRPSIAPDGALVWSELRSMTVRRVNAISGLVETLIGAPGADPYLGRYVPGPATAARLSWTLSPPAFAPDGDVVFVDLGFNDVLRINDATGDVASIATLPIPLGDGGAATDAYLVQPLDLARSGSRLFVADGGGFRIRSFNTDTGEITTFAGNGGPGATGDGGPATAAEIGQPYAIAARDNVVYFSDPAHAVVRKIDITTGIISAYAGSGVPGDSGDGGPATGAEFTMIIGLAVAPNGDLIIADTFANRIRRVDVATGIISTIAGTGSPGFSGDGGLATSAEIQGPYRVTVAPDGDVVFADTFNHRVRRIDAVTGVVATIAGTGVAGYNGDGIAATTAQFDTPTGLRFDAVGNLIVVDSLNCRIRLISVAGVISTVAGDGTCGFAGDGGAATAASLDTPIAVSVDDGTHTYVVSADDPRVRRIEGTRPNITVAVDDPGAVTVGTQTSLNVTVTNNGAGWATGPIVAEVALPTGLSFVAASGTEWTCAPSISGARCTSAMALAPIGQDPTARRVFQVQVLADGAATGTVPVTVVGTSDSDDADPTSGTHVLGITVTNASSVVTTAPTTAPASTGPGWPDPSAADPTGATSAPVRGALPRTGADPWTLTRAAAFLLVAGGFLLFATRRGAPTPIVLRCREPRSPAARERFRA